MLACLCLFVWACWCHFLFWACGCHFLFWACGCHWGMTAVTDGGSTCCFLFLSGRCCHWPESKVAIGYKNYLRFKVLRFSRCARSRSEVIRVLGFWRCWRSKKGLRLAGVSKVLRSRRWVRLELVLRWSVHWCFGPPPEGAVALRLRPGLHISLTACTRRFPQIPCCRLGSRPHCFVRSHAPGGTVLSRHSAMQAADMCSAHVILWPSPCNSKALLIISWMSTDWANLETKQNFFT